MSAALNVRYYNNKEFLLFPASIGDYLDKDHLTHIIDEAVEQINLQPLYDKISPVGSPSYHPALMVKIWFYGYAAGVYSSRKIAEKLCSDVAFIYLAGMQKPDFRTISDFRKNNIEALKRLFTQILQICHRLGMTKLGEISLDSKVMKASASSARMYNEASIIQEQREVEEEVQEYLERTNKTDQQEDEKYGANNSGSELPIDIRRKDVRISKMKKILNELQQAQEKLKGQGQSAKSRVNLTDSDARFQKDKKGIITGYKAEIAVDAKERVIVANDVTNENHDYSQLIPMIDQVLENIEEIELRADPPEQDSRRADNNCCETALGNNNQDTHPFKVLADSGYHSGSNLSKLEQGKYKGRIDLYCPDSRSPEKEKGVGPDRDSPFHKSKFTCKGNTFICPGSKVLNCVGKETVNGTTYSLYQCRDCRSCQHYGQCTTNKKGRTIHISEHQNLIERMRHKLSTKEGRDIYSRRKSSAETAIGNLSQNMGFRGFLLRGLKKVKGEFSLMCIAHNLRKIARFVKQKGINSRRLFEFSESMPIPDG